MLIWLKEYFYLLNYTPFNTFSKIIWDFPFFLILNPNKSVAIIRCEYCSFPMTKLWRMDKSEFVSEIFFIWSGVSQNVVNRYRRWHGKSRRKHNISWSRWNKALIWIKMLSSEEEKYGSIQEDCKSQSEGDGFLDSMLFHS